MAEGNAKLTVSITGKDQASAELGKVAASAKKLQDSLEGAQSRGQALTSALSGVASGDVRGGLKGLASALGPGAGIAGSAAMAAAGVAGVATAIGLAAVKVTEWSIEIERLRAQMRFAFEGGESEAIAFAEAIGGVGVEGVIKLSTTIKAAGVSGRITVEQLQQLTNAATVMGKTGDDALSAFADAVRSGSTEALKQVGVFVNGEVAIKAYAKSLGVSAETLSASQRSQAILNATLAELPKVAQAGTDAHARQDKALSSLTNAATAFKLELSAIVSGPAVEFVESLNEITRKVGGLNKIARTTARLILAPFRALYFGVQEAATAIDLAMRRDWAGAAAAAASAAAKLNPVTGALAQAIDDLSDSTDESKRKTEERTKALEASAGMTNVVAEALGQLKAGADAVTKAYNDQAAADAKAAARRKAAISAARAAAKQAKSDLDELDAGIAKLVENAGKAVDNAIEQRAASMQTLQDRVLGVAFETAESPAAKFAAQQAQIEARKVAELQRVQADQYLMTAERAQLSAAIQIDAQHQIAAAHAEMVAAQRAASEEANRLEQEQRAARLQTVEAYGSAASALAGVLLEADDAKRASAAIDAAIETARSIAAFASYDIAGGIGHAAAAAAFGKVALTSAPPPSGAAAATSQRTTAQQPAQQSVSGGQTIVNISGGLGTAAEVGAAVKKALRAVSGTGMGAAPAFGGA